MIKKNRYWLEPGFIDDLINQLPAGIFWKNTASEFLGCNQQFANFAGLRSPDDIIGKTDFDMPWGLYEGSRYRADDQLIMHYQQSKLGIEDTLTLSDGNSLTLLTSKIPLFSKQKNVIGLFGIFQDISRNKQIEVSLDAAIHMAEKAHHAKTEFIANMSHDIRTPLNGIIGMSQLLAEELQHPPHRQYALWVKESGQQLLSLLNGILDVVSSKNAVDLACQDESFNLRNVIHDLIQLEYPTIRLKNLELRIDIDKEIPQFIICDRTKLHRILLNLLGNAIKFTKIGHILIEIKLLAISSGRTHLLFRVVDTGIGIPEAIQKNVFDRFFKANPSYQGVYTGQGLGLHIAQLYVQSLGGTLHLTSEENVGTTFYFDLSFKISNSPTTSEPIKKLPATIKRPGPSSTPSLLILIVEDNRIALRIAENTASKVGCRYISAIDGEQALKLVKSMDFDLIITDIGLPGISGQEFTRYVRRWEIANHKKQIPILGLTAHVQTIVKSECLEAGMNELFTKPIDIATMQKIINDYALTGRQDDNLSWRPPMPKQFGQDLPLIELELFELDQFPLLDINHAFDNIGNHLLLREMLQLMLEKAIPDDAEAIKKAHTANDWELIEKLAHKMKGGALYCGTIRMQHACQYLERYRKAGHTAALNVLYEQLIRVVDETKLPIQAWLERCGNRLPE